MLKKIGLIIGPLLLVLILASPAPQVFSPDAWRVMGIAVLMLSWWVTEAVPLPVTALVPIVLIPFLGIAPLKETTAPYANPAVFLFLGGFMIALAMEKWKLHRRIALNILTFTGSNANGIILGFFLATGALSMWISNTATAVMMLPIAMSVIKLMAENRPASKDFQNFSLCMMLAIAYGANIGGTATIIGTPPTVVFAGFMRETLDFEVGFARWMALGIPFSILMLFISYWVLTRVLYPNKLGSFEGAEQLIKNEIKQLGSMGAGEKRTLIVFVGTAFLWIFREGLNIWLPWIQLSDEGIAVLAAVVLFVFPVNWKTGQFILKWEDTEKLPWGILLLFGGGLSLADALAKTGIITLIGEQFSGFQNASQVVVLGLTSVTLLLTEIISNLALVTIFLPMVSGIAQGIGVPVLDACILVTLASSCAFMLPMSTPPNAIVFASGHIKIMQMIKAGILLNIISILLIALVVYPLIGWVF